MYVCIGEGYGIDGMGRFGGGVKDSSSPQEVESVLYVRTYGRLAASHDETTNAERTNNQTIKQSNKNFSQPSGGVDDRRSRLGENGGKGLKEEEEGDRKPLFWGGGRGALAFEPWVLC
jgi:hypothetical protein